MYNANNELGSPVTATTDYVNDAQDRLVEVKKNNAVIAKYAYDPMGRRIWREAEGSVTWFLYSDEGLIQEISGANQLIRTYGWTPDGLWGTDTVWQTDQNGVFLTHNDHLYTTDILTKNDGTKVWSSVRESFGKTNIQAGNQTEYLMRYPGQWKDGVGDFNDNYLRNYNFYRGSYMKEDQFEFDGYGIYSYVSQNPIKMKDPYGLFASIVFPRYSEMTLEALINTDFRNRCNNVDVGLDAIDWSSSYDFEPEVGNPPKQRKTPIRMQ